MTREEYEILPPAMQLRVLSRVVLDRAVLAEIDVGKKPFKPKFDQRIGRSGGYQWASETNAEGLVFWLNRARDGASKGGKYAAKDAKLAKNLERWLAWRQWEPRTVWRGERFNVEAVAAPPTDKPEVHQYERRDGTSSDASPADDETDYSGSVSDDDVPYA